MRVRAPTPPTSVELSDSDNSFSLDGRAVWMPKFGDTQVHLGGSAHWRKLKPRSLLDNAPLLDLLQTMVPLGRLHDFVAQGRLHALAVTASSYSSGEHATFFEGADDIKPWTRSQRFGVRQRIDTTPRYDDRLHTVVEGDRLDLLAHRYLGDARLWWIICDYNDLFFPLVLEPGLALRIPSREHVQMRLLD